MSLLIRASEERTMKDGDTEIASEGEKLISAQLMQLVMALTVGAFNVLNELYIKLKVGGGIFSGRKMSEEIGKRTRHELIAYTTAMTRILLENWYGRQSVNKSVVNILESAVFSMQLASVRPAYDKYLHRYYEKLPTDSSLLPREGTVHVLFAQTLMIDIWTFAPGFDTPQSAEYSATLIALNGSVEANLRAKLDEICPKS
jgi:hypothetical protein